MLQVKKFDVGLFLPAMFLLGFGIITIASVSPANLPSHLLYVFIALVFFIFFSFLDLGILLPLSPFVYLLCVLSLVLPFLLGAITRGSVRWIPLGQFTIQPSEIIKPFLALVAGWYWARNEFAAKTFIIFCLLSFPILFLVFFQPDLGSTFSILSIFAGILFVLPVKPKHTIIFFVCMLLAVPLLWLSLKDYQKLRIAHFLNPYSDPLGKGYNIIQSKITVGSGGFWGRGLGRGTQSHLFFLPERHTDFIFASLAEEMGLVGIIIVCLLYFFLLSRILKVSRRALTSISNKSPFFFSSMGLFCFLSFQVVVNIGMNMGLLPITGITLPLISYGGSSLLSTMISLGVLENIFNNTRREDVIQIK